MDRRSFLLTLLGGSIAAATGAAVAIEPANASQLEPAVSEGLDAIEAEFSQYHHGRPVRRGPPPHARGRGPRPYRHYRRGPPPGRYRRSRYYRRHHYRRHRW